MSAPKPFLEPFESGTRLYLRVTPGARKAAIDGVRDDGEGRARLCLKVTAAPEDGKANKAVIAFLAKHIGWPKSAFTLVAGQTHRHKALFIAAPVPEVEAALPKS